MPTPAGFIYVRLHGHKRLYASNYDDDALRRWAGRVRAWATGGEPKDAATATSRKPLRRKPRDAYIYFDNTDGGHAPHNAQRLAELLDVG